MFCAEHDLAVPIRLECSLCLSLDHNPNRCAQQVGRQSVAL